jgi:hypothetical protein
MDLTVLKNFEREVMIFEESGDPMLWLQLNCLSFSSNTQPLGDCLT